MFHLETAIDDWKAACRRGDAVNEACLAELESHLRDSVAGLLDRGLSEEEAYLVATRRLGAPGELHREFGKVHVGQVWLTRFILMLSGYLLVSLLLKFVAFDQATAGWIGLALGWESAGGQLMGDIPHHWSALLNVGVGVIGVLLLLWIVLSLSRGPGHSFLRNSPETEQWFFGVLERAQEYKGRLLLWWIVLYALLSAGQLALQVVASRTETLHHYSHYMASVNLYQQVGNLLTFAFLLAATAVLAKRHGALREGAGESVEQ